MAGAEGPCVEWQGYRLVKGYGYTTRKGLHWQTHRLAWTEKNGPIPEGMYVLHRCDNPPCINVDHLWLGTNLDNMRDMIAKRRHCGQKKTHCPRGHAYDEANTRHDAHGRVCRKCKVILQRAYRVRKAAREAVA